TKSGTTIETMGQFWIVYDQMRQQLGASAADARVVAVTDPVSGGLRQLATERGWRTFSVPPNVGGRFSALTAVGLVPLALAGFDVVALLEGAASARDRALHDAPADNASLLAAWDQLALLERGVSQVVMMVYNDAALSLVDWFSQLWAESLGKQTRRDGRLEATGITPIKALGAVDQHSQVQLYMEGPLDKHVCFIQ